MMILGHSVHVLYTRAYRRFCQGGGGEIFFHELKVVTINEKRKFWKKSQIYFAKLRYYAPGAKANRGGGEQGGGGASSPPSVRL